MTGSALGAEVKVDFLKAKLQKDPRTALQTITDAYLTLVKDAKQKRKVGDPWPVIIIDEANALMEWKDAATLSALLKFFVYLTKQEQLAHVILATSDTFLTQWLDSGAPRLWNCVVVLLSRRLIGLCSQAQSKARSAPPSSLLPSLRLVRARRLKRLRVSRRLPGATALRSAPRGVAVRPQVRSSRTGGAADGLLGAGLNQLGGRCGGAAVQGSARYTLQRRPHGRAVPRAGHSVARATGPRVRPSRPESGSQDQGLLCFIFSPRSGSRAASSLCARASAARTAGLWLRVKG